MENPRIAIVGSGMIGRSWAIAFARSGHEVRLFDHIDGAGQSALSQIEDTLRSLEQTSLLGGKLTGEICALISVSPTLSAALDGAAYIQENTPETLDIKKAIFSELEAHAPADAILASSTSALLPSAFTAGLATAARCLVAHPLNPPHLIPAVEIVPSPATADEAVIRAAEILTSIGQSPIVARQEVPGFIMNRLQGALLDEAFSLVGSGVASVEDIDRAVRDGLARRWCLTGPFETIDLNAPDGVVDFIGRYGPAYATIARTRTGHDGWTGPLGDVVADGRRRVLPVEKIPNRQRWRDKRLSELADHLAQTREE